MPFDMTNALFVADQGKYAQYRAEIAPLLEAIGGAFRYDFEIAKTLRNEADHDINRVFILRFPSRAAKDRFFADPQYQAIRGRLFEPAVRHMTTIAEHAA
jgi:uncharacterized protein (DUF1330 family)